MPFWSRKKKEERRRQSYCSLSWNSYAQLNSTLQHMPHRICSCRTLKQVLHTTDLRGARPVSCSAAGHVGPWYLCFPLTQLLQLPSQGFLMQILSEQEGLYNGIWADLKSWQGMCLPKEWCLSSSYCVAAVCWGQLEPSWAGEPHSAVCSTLPCMMISSNIRRLISEQCNIILQPSRQAEFAAMAIMTDGSLHTKKIVY